MLRDWMARNTTGGPYIRAGVPSGWQVEDKTGSGGYGTRDDVAVLRPPGRSPLVIAVLSDRGVANAPSDDALIADATRVALAALTPPQHARRTRRPERRTRSASAARRGTTEAGCFVGHGCAGGTRTP